MDTASLQRALDRSETYAQNLENGIRKLRDEWVRGDDKCWKDLVELFELLPEGFTLPAMDTSVELSYCEQYIKSCHHPDVKYVSPQRRIEELEDEISRINTSINRLIENDLGGLDQGNVMYVEGWFQGDLLRLDNLQATFQRRPDGK